MPACVFPAEPRRAWDWDVPRYVVPLEFEGDPNPIELQLVFDTGSEVSLIPAALAQHFKLAYSTAGLTTGYKPNTLRGKLTGTAGLVQARMFQPADGFDIRFPLPCFFYQSPPPPVGDGTPAKQQAPPPNLDLAQFIRTELRGSAKPTKRGNDVCVLGRLGFLSRFRVFAHAARFVVATQDTDLLGRLR
jgi:hypothetical protein